MTSIVNVNNNRNNIPCERVTGNLPKCKQCGRFHGCKLFDMFCSCCFKDKNYDKWYDIVGQYCDQTRLYSDEFLKKLTDTRKMPDDSVEFKTLRTIFKKRSVYDKNIVWEFLHHLFTNTPYKGISLKQAQVLWLDFHEMGNEFQSKTPYSHLLCGMIIDWWNINLNSAFSKIGGAACYYVSTGKYKKPIMNSYIRPPVIYIHSLLKGYKTVLEEEDGSGCGNVGRSGISQRASDTCINDLFQDKYNRSKGVYCFWYSSLAWKL
jgi:hypothetical protein